MTLHNHCTLDPKLSEIKVCSLHDEQIMQLHQCRFSNNLNQNDKKTQLPMFASTVVKKKYITETLIS